MEFLLVFLKDLAIDLFEKLFGSVLFHKNKKVGRVYLVREARFNATWWHAGTFQGSTKRMQIVGDYHVTNGFDQDIHLPSAKLKTRKLFRATTVTDGQVLVKDLGSVYSGDYPIPAGAKTTLRFTFSDVPMLQQEGMDLIADVAIIDQFANEHWIKRVRFMYS